MDRVLREPEVEAVTGLSPSTRRRLERAGQFPRRRRLAGGRAVGWLSSEVEAWARSRVQGDGTAPKAAGRK